jgi:predicted sugar kinase
VIAKHKGMEGELGEQRVKVNDIENVILKNMGQSNRMVEEELGRFEKIVTAMQKYMEKQFREVKEQREASQVQEEIDTLARGARESA